MFVAGAIAGDMILRLGKWSDGIRTVKRDEGDLKRRLAGLKADAASFAKGLGLAGTAVTGFFALTVKQAMRVQEAENLFEVSMGNMAASTRAWSEELASAIGMNANTIREGVGNFNVMLGSMGLAEKSAAAMSQEFTKLAYDMASFYNLDPTEAFDKLRAGLSGEAEPLKRLGILVNETTTELWALEKGLIASGEKMNEQQKVVARFGAIMEQTGKAQGDMARTGGSATNQWRRLTEQTLSLTQAMGGALLPSVTEYIGKANAAVSIGINWVKGNEELAASFVKVTAAVAVTASGLGAMALVAPIVTRAFKGITATAAVMWAAITSPISLTIAAIASVGAAVYALRVTWINNFGGIRDALVGFGSQVRDVFAAIWVHVKSFLNGFVQGFMDAASKALSWIKDLANRGIGIFDWWKTAISTGSMAAADRMLAQQKDYIGALGDMAKSGAQVVGDAVGGWAFEMKAGFGELTEIVGDFLPEFSKAFKEQLNSDFGSIVASLREKIPSLENALSGDGFEGYTPMDFNQLLEGARGSTEALAGTKKAASEAAQEVQSLAFNMGHLGDIASEVGAGMQESFSGAANWIVDVASQVGGWFDGIKAKADETVIDLGERFSELGSRINGIGDSLKSTFVTKIGAIVSSIGSFQQAIKSVSESLKAMKGAGEQSFTKTLSGVVGMTTGVLGAVGAVASLGEAFGLFGDKAVKELKGIDKMMDELKDKLDEWADRLTDTIVDFVKTGKASFREFVDSVLEDMLRLSIRNLVVGPVFDAIGGAFAKGGAYSSAGIIPLAKGHVTDGPEFFQSGGKRYVRGEAGPEAIMPLKRLGNGNLGVQAQGGGEGVQVIVNDYRSGGEAVQVSERSGPDGRRQLLVTIRDAISELAADGQLDRTMSTNWRLRRQPV